MYNIYLLVIFYKIKNEIIITHFTSRLYRTEIMLKALNLRYLKLFMLFI
jgi:hypothetical protein